MDSVNIINSIYELKQSKNKIGFNLNTHKTIADLLSDLGELHFPHKDEVSQWLNYLLHKSKERELKHGIVTRKMKCDCGAVWSLKVREQNMELSIPTANATSYTRSVTGIRFWCPLCSNSMFIMNIEEILEIKSNLEESNLNGQ